MVSFLTFPLTVPFGWFGFIGAVVEGEGNLESGPSRNQTVHKKNAVLIARRVIFSDARKS